MRVVRPKKTNKTILYGEERFYEGAYKRALENRKFEIDNYWKRTTYFWTLIAALFTGHFLALNNQNLLATFVTVSLGIVVSLGWFLTNKASKFWQQNWEAHVDALEDFFDGPIYKTVFVKTNKNKSSDWLYGASAFSVSKINQLISFCVFLIWFCLFINSICTKFSSDEVGLAVIVIVKLISLLIVYALSYGLIEACKTSLPKKTHSGPWPNSKLVKRP